MASNTNSSPVNNPNPVNNIAGANQPQQEKSSPPASSPAPSQPKAEAGYAIVNKDTGQILYTTGGSSAPRSISENLAAVPVKDINIQGEAYKTFQGQAGGQTVYNIYNRFSGEASVLDSSKPVVLPSSSSSSQDFANRLQTQAVAPNSQTFTPEKAFSFNVTGSQTALPVANQIQAAGVQEQNAASTSAAGLEAQRFINSSSAFTVVGGQKFLTNPNAFAESLKTYQQSLEVQKAGLQNRISLLQGQFQPFEQEKANLESRISSVNLNDISSVTALNQDIANFNSKLQGLMTSRQGDINSLTSEIQAFNVKGEALNLLGKSFNIYATQSNFGINLVNSFITNENAFRENQANPLLKPLIPTGIQGINLTIPFANAVTKSTITNQEIAQGVNPNLTSNGSPLFPLSFGEKLAVSAVTIGGTAAIFQGLAPLIPQASEAAAINLAGNFGLQGSTQVAAGQILRLAATGGIQGGVGFAVSKALGIPDRQALIYAGYGLIAPAGKIVGIGATQAGFSPVGSSFLAFETSLVGGTALTYENVKNAGGVRAGLQATIPLLAGSAITALSSYNAFSETLDYAKSFEKPLELPQINVKARGYESSIQSPSTKYPSYTDVEASKESIASFKVSGEGIAGVKSITTGSATVFDQSTFVSQPSEKGVIYYPSGATVKYSIPETAVYGIPFSKSDLVTAAYSSEALQPFKTGISEDLGVSGLGVARTIIPARSVSGIPISSGINEFRPEEVENLIYIRGFGVTDNSKILFRGIESSTGETTLGTATSGVVLKADVLTLTGKGLTTTPVTLEENTLLTATGQGIGSTPRSVKPVFESFEGGGLKTPFSDVVDTGKIRIGSAGYNKLISDNPKIQLKVVSADYVKIIKPEGISETSNQAISGGSSQGVQGNIFGGSVPTQSLLQGKQISQVDQLAKAIPSIQEVYLTPSRLATIAGISRTVEAGSQLTSGLQIGNIFVNPEAATTFKSITPAKEIQVFAPRQILPEFKTVSVQEEVLSTKLIPQTSVLNQINVRSSEQEAVKVPALQVIPKTDIRLENQVATKLENLQLQELQTQTLQETQFQPLNINPLNVPAIFGLTLPPFSRGSGGSSNGYSLFGRGRLIKRKKGKRRLLYPVDILAATVSEQFTGKATAPSLQVRKKAYESQPFGVVPTKELFALLKRRNSRKVLNNKLFNSVGVKTKKNIFGRRMKNMKTGFKKLGVRKIK